MPSHITGTRDEWLAAQLELLAAEKELTRRSDELARRRQALPWVRIDKEYRFETDEGSGRAASAPSPPRAARAAPPATPPASRNVARHGSSLPLDVV